MSVPGGAQRRRPVDSGSRKRMSNGGVLGESFPKRCGVIGRNAKRVETGFGRKCSDEAGQPIGVLRGVGNGLFRPAAVAAQP